MLFAKVYKVFQTAKLFMVFFSKHSSFYQDIMIFTRIMRLPSYLFHHKSLGKGEKSVTLHSNFDNNTHYYIIIRKT